MTSNLPMEIGIDPQGAEAQGVDTHGGTYNLTYNDTIKKYTINLTLDQHRRLKELSQRAGILRMSIYIRAIINKHLDGEDTLSERDIVFYRHESMRVAPVAHREQRRKDMEIIERSWVKKNFKRVVDMFSDRQYNLFR